MALTNQQIIKGILPKLPAEYQSRIPVDIQSNMQEVANNFFNYPVIANEFCNALTNQIIQSYFLTKPIVNRLEVFEKGNLSQYGESIQLIFVDSFKGKSFTDLYGGSYEAEMWAPEDMDNVKVQYLTTNARLKYKTTVSTEMLARAFQSEYGLSNLINQQTAKLQSNYNLDKLLLTWKLLDEMDTVKMTGIQKPVDTATSKAFTIALKTLILNMGYPSREYNTSGVMTQCFENDIVIVTTNEIKSCIDVELLAQAFNMDKVEIDSMFVCVPAFADENKIAMVMDKDKVQIYNNLTASSSTYNNAHLFTNIFLNKWDTIGACDFANCVELRVSDEVVPTDESKLLYKRVDKSPSIEKMDTKKTTVKLNTDGTTESVEEKTK